MKWALDGNHSQLHWFDQFLANDGSLFQTLSKNCFEQELVHNDDSSVVADLVVYVNQVGETQLSPMHDVDKF